MDFCGNCIYPTIVLYFILEWSLITSDCEGGYGGCCQGYIFNPIFGNCTECSAGYIGENCSFPCPSPSYGRGCQKICNCKKEECHFIQGCKEKITDQCPYLSQDWNRSDPCDLQNSSSFNFNVNCFLIFSETPTSNHFTIKTFSTTHTRLSHKVQESISSWNTSFLIQRKDRMLSTTENKGNKSSKIQISDTTPSNSVISTAVNKNNDFLLSSTYLSAALTTKNVDLEEKVNDVDDIAVVLPVLIVSLISVWCIILLIRRRKQCCPICQQLHGSRHGRTIRERGGNEMVQGDSKWQKDFFLA